MQKIQCIITLGSDYEKSHTLAPVLCHNTFVVFEYAHEFASTGTQANFVFQIFDIFNNE